MRSLVAIDDSDPADRALSYAAEITAAMDASLTVVHAVDPAVYDVGGSEPISSRSDADQRLIVENIADTETRGQAVLESALETIDGVDAEGELLYGDPDVAITDFADQQGFDAIFVGHQGRSRRAEAMLGSVAKAVVERATVPVTVVR
ncbi:universal stress protein UspA-like protein [Halovivax ruber XH-70]|uniref:Universal stress protein UspA-like protein n=1 Tax=Halovivax ruber (strain DSM 18193 / JCM 13892 / XH-70) TaxID=797302 RepID=L0I967_HALRX|nr:universal stress protein [Halovivax ruber]AGB15343.1 universal stress protein UspA-like protein [Halovivax ruber XH-70]